MKIARGIQFLSYNEVNRVHDRLKKRHGSATKCMFCKRKDQPKYEWALMVGKHYTSNPESYLQLCSKCHTNYDLIHKHLHRYVVGMGEPRGGLTMDISKYKGI